MKECRDCGAELSISMADEKKEVARRTIKSFKSLLNDEGQELSRSNVRTIRQIISESQLVLDDEVPDSQALCDECRKSRGIPPAPWGRWGQ